MTTGPKTKTIELIATRTIAAYPADVFDAWLDSRQPGNPWFGVSKATVNPTVDGLFYHLVHFDNRDWPHYGRFIALKRPHLIQHSWVSEPTLGLESIVTLTLDAHGDETNLTLNHANVPDNELGRRHQGGWEFLLGALADRFSRRL